MSDQTRGHEGLERAIRLLRNEVDCRIEHGAESGGHLEFVRAELDAVLASDRAQGPGPPRHTLTDDEVDEADRMYRRYLRRGDPYALTRVVEHFLRDRLSSPPPEQTNE